MSVKNVQVDKLNIEGFDTDYVFQTIEKTHNYYEYEILNSWSKYFYNSQVIFDVGANIGNHSMYWSIKINPDIIYSFEPFVPNFERLKNNVTNNGIKNVKMINKGIGEKNGFASIKSFDETNYGSTSLKYNEGVNKDETDEIEIISLDSFIEEENIKSVDFIKIDVEGFEVSVIRGMLELLNKFKPDLWIEVGLDTFREIFEILMPLGYVLVDVEGFNVLLLHESRHNKIKEVEQNKILEKMFYYLNRTNSYYKNYITAKQWVEQKNKLLEQKTDDYNNLKDNYEILNEKFKTSTENYNTVKTWHANLKEKYDAEKNHSLELEKQVKHYENIEKLFKEETNSHADYLLEHYTELNSIIEFIKELKGNIQRLETQNSYLKHENSEYRRKLSKITDTRLGKIGLKVYYLFKKIRIKIK